MRRVECMLLFCCFNCHHSFELLIGLLLHNDFSLSLDIRLYSVSMASNIKKKICGSYDGSEILPRCPSSNAGRFNKSVRQASISMGGFESSEHS